MKKQKQKHKLNQHPTTQSGLPQVSSTHVNNVSGTSNGSRTKELGVEQALLEVLQPLPKDQQQRAISIVRRTVEEEYSGPLPHPEHFARFDQVVPGAAQTILDMSKAEQAHRHEWEMKALGAQVSDTKRGQWLAAFVAAALVGGGVYCATIDQPWVAVVMVGTSLVGACAMFINGRKRQNANAVEKPRISSEKPGRK